jgi:hypothetical protein
MVRAAKSATWNTPVPSASASAHATIMRTRSGRTRPTAGSASVLT